MTKSGWIWMLCCALTTGALEPTDYSFLLSATTVASPPKISITWPRKDVSQITVRKKPSGDANWGPAINLPGNSVIYEDSNIQAGKAYEYEFQAIVQTAPVTQRAFGYICAGTQVSPVDRRGKIALIVDQTHAAALASELEQLRKDLNGDGWSVVRRDVSPGASVTSVKALVRSEYIADPSNMRAVFLIGHVPVPYSGVINPDMHPNHIGAWPADVYYGEMDGNWTDSTANYQNGEFDWNHNVPGDGKFDQSTIPGEVELEVGRVDFFDLPAFAPRSERELLRNYLRKNHAFRHREIQAPARGLIRDNFEVIGDDAPAADAHRAFSVFFSQTGYSYAAPGQFFPTLANNAFLWAYAGGGGDFTKADGVGSTDDFVAGDPRAFFYLLHGSYFGDWNTEDNFLRAALATPNYGLVSIFSSLPHWYFHHLALGETIGYATRLTQNNRYGIYRNDVDLSIGEVHISMMGDPTLRPFPLAPPANLRITTNAGAMTLQWSAAAEPVDGYHLFVAQSYDGPWSRVNRRIITGTTFEQAVPAAGRYIYMLKSGALQTTASGSFNNLSQGAFAEFESGGAVATPTISITAIDSVADESGNSLVFEISRTQIQGSLAVNLQFAGTSAPGIDYVSSSTVNFESGNPTAKLTIVPLADGIAEYDETVTVSVAAGPGYTIGAPATAVGTIQRSGESRFTGWTYSRSEGATFSAIGFANRPYRIEGRTPAGSWVVRTNGVAAADGSLSYRPNASGEWEFFRVVWD